MLSRQLMYWLLAGSKGGPSRTKIILFIRQKPVNTRQLATKMGMHYTTIQHHVDILLKNGFLVYTGEGYGKVLFLSQDLEDIYGEFQKIAEKIG